MQMNANLHCSDGEGDYLQKWEAILRRLFGYSPMVQLQQINLTKRTMLLSTMLRPLSIAPVNKLPDMAKRKEG